ncbi:putative NACHT domain-containing protein [Seiridium cardinale]|uniref:NACHT domain-containing protein n=1 Tax=Seiridium cardinale TaxID=138064 RepID=A0ABR2XY92_9PEZI
MIDSLIITYSSKVWRLTFYWHTDIRVSPGSNGSVEKISTQLESIGVKTNDIANATDAKDRRIEESLDITKSIYLKPRILRSIQVQEVGNDTFRWLFDGPNYLLEKVPTLKTTLVDCLRSGSGILHVVGKAGAGMSTLVKFICEEADTKSMLHEWAGSSQMKLVFSKFFFWKVTMNAEQKTLKGLVRSLLHDLPEQVPSLVLQLFLKHSANDGKVLGGSDKFQLSDRETKTALDSMMRQPEVFNDMQLRLCFFIDDLDEFEQGYRLQRETQHDLARQLQAWAENSRGNIKMCSIQARHTHYLLMC